MSSKITANDLSTLFGACGKVESAEILQDKTSGDPSGRGFVLMASATEGFSAIAALQGRKHKGQVLIVKEARPGR